MTDFASSGQGVPWGHTRFYSNQRHRDGALVNESWGQGVNWGVDNWPYLANFNDDNSIVVICFSQEFSVFFSKSDSTYTPINGAEDRYTLAADTVNDVFKLTDPQGTVWEFLDFSAAPGIAGLLSKATMSGGQLLEVTSYTSSSIAEVQKTYSDGMLYYTEKYSYSYSGALLTSVTLERRLGSGPYQNIQRCSYEYYDGTDGYGSLNDLKMTVSERWNGSEWEDPKTHYYRYYIDSADGVGFQHGLWYVLSPESYRRAVLAGIDPLWADSSELDPFADYRLEYDSNQQVTREVVMGGAREYSFALTNRTGTLVDDLNEWRVRMVMTQPDNSIVTVFTNYIGQAILHVLEDATTSQSWCNFFEYDTSARVISHANSSAVQSWSLSSTSAPLSVSLYSSDGLIELHEYPTSTTATAITGTTSSPSQAGDVKGYKKSQKIKRGTGGTPITLQEMKYFRRTVVTETVYPAQDKSFRNDNGTGAVETNYSYTWQSALPAILERVTTLPAIPTAQNGSNSSNTRAERYSVIGELIWTRDEAGYINNQGYDVATGALVQSIVDVDDTQLSVPSGWSTPAGGGLHLTTDYSIDLLGRTTLSQGPIHDAVIDGVSTSVRTISNTLYLDTLEEVRSAQGYASGSAHSEYTLYNPISITKSDDAGRPVQQIQATRGTSTSSPGLLLASDTFEQSSYVRWSTSTYNDKSQLVSSDVYFDIPESGLGKKNVNFNRTYYRYDSMGRQNYVMSASGSVSTTIFDVRGLPISRSAAIDTEFPGTPGRSWQNQVNRLDVNDDGEVTDVDALLVINFLNANPGSTTLPEPPVNPPPPPPYYDVSGNGVVTPLDALTIVNYLNAGGSISESRLITSYQYDGGTGGGDRNLTRETQHVNSTSGDDRVTEYTYDWRNRRISVDGEIDLYMEYEYDNLDRVVVTQRRNTTSSGTLLGKQETLYDDLGRVYQSITYAVNPSSGSIGNSLVDQTWYDARGNVAKLQPAGSKAFSKTFYDGVGRSTATFTGYDTSETSYADALTVTGDTIFEQSETLYDNASNVLFATSRQRFHNATGTGSLQGPSGSEPKSRDSYMAMWYDGIGRSIASASYGTNDNAGPPTRPSIAPASSDEVLVSLSRYNARGEAFESVDPSGMVSHVDADDAGRTVRTIQNYVPCDCDACGHEACSECSCPGAEENVTTEMQYGPGGQLIALIAKNPLTGDQTTRYEYKVTTAGGSDIASNDLLSAEIYPDAADADDRVTYSYNRQGERKTMRDQNGSVHSYSYDKLGRQTADTVTTLASGVDDGVLRIGATFDVRGLVEKITSFSDTSGTAPVNEVQNSYNDFGQLVEQYQEHDGAVDAGTPKVGYSYENGSDNTIRLTSMTYPSGEVLSYLYDDTAADNLSRVRTLSKDATEVCQYTYLGLSTFVTTDYLEPEIKLDYVLGSGANPYAGFDRFGRVIDHWWTAYGASSSSSSSSSGSGSSLVHLKYGYNRSSSRTYKEDLVAQSYDKDFDELYEYDGLQRLKKFHRGRLSIDHQAITSPALQQRWDLDATGNWSNFTQNVPSDISQIIDQQRTSNTVNEITAIARTVGPEWAAPLYDRNGNMTMIPQPKVMDIAYRATWDPWNRLVKLEEQDESDAWQTVQENEYSGQTWRIKVGTPVGSLGSELAYRHYYYTSIWQDIEERLEQPEPVSSSSSSSSSSSTPTMIVERQQTWGLRYIDDLVLRDRSTSPPDPFDERIYGLQDANWNMVALYYPDTVLDKLTTRFVYDPYGVPTSLDTAFVTAANSYAWNQLYCSYYLELNTHLSHVRFRILHSKLGNWINRDPIGYLNNDRALYRYVENYPLIHSDPSGKSRHHWFRQIGQRTEFGQSVADSFCKPPLNFNIDDFTTELGELSASSQGAHYTVEYKLKYQYWHDITIAQLKAVGASCCQYLIAINNLRIGMLAALSHLKISIPSIELINYSTGENRDREFLELIAKACPPPLQDNKRPVPVRKPVRYRYPTVDIPPCSPALRPVPVRPVPPSAPPKPFWQPSLLLASLTALPRFILILPPMLIIEPCPPNCDA
ncbi:YD repeat protein [Pirellula staleyi DSM 6068]|uniref:YD repeat protein n=1 Tax=Pirellula staleyi (strain ATCC 27377 / DSM 6068 / ICPB 4128) TaxID=530564 RepID=D2QZZ5_PIRSD|nr:dockerin type I domain-containing protein [Pirellula staleyi]ADB18360.1 YD repeat protein [Pirellula staleyi DSM 6068]